MHKFHKQQFITFQARFHGLLFSNIHEVVGTPEYRGNRENFSLLFSKLKNFSETDFAYPGNPNKEVSHVEKYERIKCAHESVKAIFLRISIRDRKEFKGRT